MGESKCGDGNRPADSCLSAFMHDCARVYGSDYLDGEPISSAVGLRDAVSDPRGHEQRLGNG